MRVLFDQAVPVPLRPFLVDCDVRTAAQQGWDRLENGDLILAAEQAGFHVFLTTDKNIRYQQSLTDRSIAIILICKQQWPQMREHIPNVVAAVLAATPGSYSEIEIP